MVSCAASQAACVVAPCHGIARWRSNRATLMRKGAPLYLLSSGHMATRRDARRTALPRLQWRCVLMQATASLLFATKIGGSGGGRRSDVPYRNHCQSY